MTRDGVVIINVVYAHGGFNLGLIDIDPGQHTHLNDISHLVVHNEFEVVSVMGKHNAQPMVYSHDGRYTIRHSCSIRSTLYHQ